MKKLIWLLPLLIILGAMLVTVVKSSAQTREVTINYDYGNLTDTSGRVHSVRLVFHHDGSVTWRDLRLIFDKAGSHTRRITVASQRCRDSRFR